MEPLSRALGEGVVDSAPPRAPRVRAAQFTPSARAWIGIDVRVGGTAADFVEVPRAGARSSGVEPLVAAAEPPATGVALVRAADAGFAGTLHRAIAPAQDRLSNEVEQLRQIRAAALDYLKARPSNEGQGR